jgi:hypothetical protein
MHALTFDEINFVNGADRGDAAVAGAIAGVLVGTAGGPGGMVAGGIIGIFVAVGIYDHFVKAPQ